MRHCIAIILSLLFVLPAAAVDSARSIRIIGRKSATVTTRRILLADIAQVSSPELSDDEAVIALQKIVIADSPLPGAKITLSASQILERLREQGVNLNSVGYTLHRVVTVARAGRVLRSAEVRAAIEEFFASGKRDAVLKGIAYNEDIQLAPGLTKLAVRPYDSTRAGEMGFEVVAEVEGEQPVSFKVPAQIDEWRELPVAARPLQRGAVIGEGDIKMARLNISAIPHDAAADKAGLIGMEAEQAIGYGEVFRRNKLLLPPVISSGSRVTLVYKTALITATASGVALESGQEGEEIKVRNTASKKIVSGMILEPGLVGVN